MANVAANTNGGVTRPVQPYEAPAPTPAAGVAATPVARTDAYAAPHNRRKNVLPVVLVVGGVLLLTILAAGFGGRLFGGATGGGAQEPAANLPIVGVNATPSGPSVVPDFRGMDLKVAQFEAAIAGLELQLAQAVYDAQYPVNTIARQDQPPGTQVAAGTTIRVSLSLGAAGENGGADAPTPTPPGGDEPADSTLPEIIPPVELPPAVERGSKKHAPGWKKRDKDDKKDKGEEDD
jgi:hypothetical protein